MKNLKCLICSSINIKDYSDYKFNDPCFEGLKIVRCLDCDFKFSHPMPNEMMLEKYNSSYHDSAHGGMDRDKKTNAFFSGISRLRLHFIESWHKLNQNSKLKVLEIGPGPGAFARVFLEKYVNSDYFAIESDVSCHKKLTELGVKIIKPDKSKSFEQSFDLLIASHVLEHLTNPFDFITDCKKFLKINGVCFIEVPCKDWEFKTENEPHLLFFDKKPMENLLEKVNVVILKVSYYGTLISDLKNNFKIFFKKIIRFLFRKGISFYHPEKSSLRKLLSSDLEANSLITFDAHKEKSEPSWWLRVLFKKI